ncbi:MAG TPA: PqqD family protein [Acidimicrobiales bacterium]|nr:PqqD family protein [Acidimicrobiales bacterium]
MTHTHDHHDAEPVDGSWAPRPAPELTTVEIDGEALLLDPRTDGVHQLDRLGSVIWQVLDGEATVDELVDDLAAAFAAPPEQVRHDLGDLLVGLRGIGALDGAGPPDWMLRDSPAPPAEGDDDLWRPSYLVDPPAP